MDNQLFPFPFPQRELLHQQFAGFICPTDGDNGHLFFNQVLKQNQQKNIDLAITLLNGNVLQAHLECVSMLDGDHQPALRIALTDIAKLKRQEDKWRTLFQILPVGVSLFDREGNIVELNDCAQPRPKTFRCGDCTNHYWYG